MRTKDPRRELLGPMTRDSGQLWCVFTRAVGKITRVMLKRSSALCQVPR